MIIRSAAVKLHQWDREEEHLDHIKRRTSAQARQNPPFVSEEFEHYRLIVSALRCAPIFSSFCPPFV